MEVEIEWVELHDVVWIDRAYPRVRQARVVVRCQIRVSTSFSSERVMDECEGWINEMQVGLNAFYSEGVLRVDLSRVALMEWELIRLSPRLHRLANGY